jgi:hypothetical protein
MTQIESVAEPNSVANYRRRESMALVSDHPRMIQVIILQLVIEAAFKSGLRNEKSI